MATTDNWYVKLNNLKEKGAQLTKYCCTTINYDPCEMETEYLLQEKLMHDKYLSDNSDDMIYFVGLLFCMTK